MSRTNSDATELIELGDSIVRRARSAGADVAEASVHSGSHPSVKVRMDEPELVEEAGSRALGLRVMLGQRVADEPRGDPALAEHRLLEREDDEEVVGHAGQALHPPRGPEFQSFVVQPRSR